MFNGAMARHGTSRLRPLHVQCLRPERGSRFPGDVIPSLRINPVARNLLAYYLPGSTLTSRPSNVFGNPRNTLNDDQGSMRIDLAPKPQHQLALQYFGQSTPVDHPDCIRLAGPSISMSFSLAGLEHTWTLSTRAVNSFPCGIPAQRGNGRQRSRNSLLSSIGIANTFGDRGIGLVNLQGYSSLGIPLETLETGTTHGKSLTS